MSTSVKQSDHAVGSAPLWIIDCEMKGNWIQHWHVTCLSMALSGPHTSVGVFPSHLLAPSHAAGHAEAAFLVAGANLVVNGHQVVPVSGSQVAK